MQTQERARQLLLPRFQDERAPGQHRPTVPGVNLLSLLAHCRTGVGQRWSCSPSASDYSSTSATGSRFLKRTLTRNRAFKNLKLDTDFILSLVWFWTFLSFHIHMCGFVTYSQKKKLCACATRFPFAFICCLLHLFSSPAKTGSISYHVLCKWQTLKKKLSSCFLLRLCM